MPLVKKLPVLTGMATIIASGVALAQNHVDTVVYKDIAVSEETGLDYRRIESPRFEFLQEIRNRGFFYPDDGFNNPLKANGAPGVAVWDYDNDGDLDLYVTNGPGRSNSLYQNQYNESGELRFVDVAMYAHVGLSEKDSTGVCYGDIDNDGDDDLLVLSSGQGHTLLKNNGNGRFTDISEFSGLGGEGLYSSSCSMGDVNGDGMLDFVIANTYDNWDNFGPIVSFEEAHRNQDNQLFLNKKHYKFDDVSEAAGITNYQGITWAVALVDYDADGDVDLIAADDQGAKPGVIRGGFDTGYVRIYNNDGEGMFEDVTEAVGTNRFGAWMGLAFADYNSDGHLDIFATNIGDYMARFMENIVPFPIVEGDWNSGWFLGNEEGTFDFPNVGDLKATPFGWGAIAVDYDNDMDTDVVYQGGIDMGAFADAANPGSVLNNDGQANFSLDKAALAQSTDHTRREVMGLASGDFNNDGFVDLVSVSSVNWEEPKPLAPYINRPFDGPFDEEAYIWAVFTPNNPDDFMEGFTWTGISGSEGTVSLELSDQTNGNQSVQVKVSGSYGLVKGASVNRNGIGAIVKFTPDGGSTATVPVVSGASYASQSTLTQTFGLGSEADMGVLDIQWPGGVKNRLYGVMAGEMVNFPEIPCSIDSNMKEKKYKRCVRKSLRSLKREGVLSRSEARRIFQSAMMAFNSNHH